MNFFERTSADKNSIGFTYQDYVALKHALELMPEEQIGIEVYDDLHLENIEGHKTFIQVKHSINESNITNKDIDLWKTLYNWSETIKLIHDKSVSLIFYTNKGLTLEKGIVQLLSCKDKNINEIKGEISNTLKNHKNKNDDLYKYITAINILPDDISEKLINSISFQYGVDGIIQKIKTLLKTFSVPDNKINDVFHNISGAFIEYKYNLVKNHDKIKLSYEDFRKKLAIDRIIQISRNCINNFDGYYKFESAYPNNIESENSYKQLRDLDLHPNLIVKNINEMAKTEAFIQKLQSIGELTEQEKDLIYQKVFDEWETKHFIAYIKDNYTEINKEHLEKALSVYSELAGSCDITIENNKLPRSMTVGAFLHLSNEPVIGWLQHWESLYK
ncbi:hypothetical protein [Providencia manganoxydans]|uniref:hypothetical protein n=1 Tax=Providencia manganoxydans TaxID=2923283 RepID=UPI0034DD2AE6